MCRVDSVDSVDINDFKELQVDAYVD